MITTRRRKQLPVPVIIVSGVTVFMLLAAAILSVAGGRDSPRTSQQPSKPPARPGTRQPPQMASLGPGGRNSTAQQAVLDWIQENADDPDIEVVKWEGPITKFPGEEYEKTYIRLKYRVKRGQSGKSLEDQIFRIYPGQAEPISNPSELSWIIANWNREEPPVRMKR